MPLSSRKEVSQYVQRKLIFRLQRLAIIFTIIFSILIVELSLKRIPFYIALAGFLAGAAIGMLISRRMHTITWDEETSKAVTRMDTVGIILLILYLLFVIFRHWIFAFWIDAYVLTPLSLSIAAGGMLGRLYFTRRKIRRLLNDAGVLWPEKENND
jgi:hypothetical protein